MAEPTTEAGRRLLAKEDYAMPEDILAIEQEAASAGHEACDRLHAEAMAEIERLMAERDALAEDEQAASAAVAEVLDRLNNLPQWAMVGQLNNRHMEAVRPGHYWDIAEVRAALIAESREEGT